MVPAEPAAEPIVEPLQPVEPQLADGDNVPDWLKSLSPVEASAESDVEPQQPIEPQPVNDEIDQERFKVAAPVEVAGETTLVPPQPVEPQPVINNEVPDWLKSMAAVDADKAAIAEPRKSELPQSGSSEDIPDWFKSMTHADEAAGLNTESEPISPELPAMESEPETTPTEPASIEAEAFQDWSTGMGVQATAPAETLGQPLTGDQAIPVEPVDQAPVIPPAPEPGTSGESFQPSGEVKPLNIGDDALGWLESLAAKQGAKPEELLTNPLERSVDMPDWLRQPGEKPGEIPEVTAQAPVLNPHETLPLEPLDRFADLSAAIPNQPVGDSFSPREEGQPLEPPEQVVANPVVQPAGDQQDTMAWLEQLSGDQEKTPEEPLLRSEENLETSPIEEDQIQEEQPAVNLPEESIPAVSELPNTDDITITSWLSRLDVEEALGKTAKDQTGADKPAVPEEELPDWLKDLESPAKPVETPKDGEDLPEWLRHPISSAQPEFTSEPESPAWVDENVQNTGQAAPTLPEEWVPAEAKAEPGLEPIPAPESLPVDENLPSSSSESTSETGQVAESEPVAEPVSFSVQTLMRSPTLKQTGMLSAIPVQDKDAELLSNAQTVLDQDSLDESMKLYLKLIKKGHLLDEVIHDLREAIYRYPVDVIIWQTLGDAYMRANRLQDALDAYTKAEELLR